MHETLTILLGYVPEGGFPECECEVCAALRAYYYYRDRFYGEEAESILPGIY